MAASEENHQKSEKRESTEDRLEALRKEVEGLKKKRKDFWDKLQAASSIISGLVIVGVGYVLTDSVKTALQRQELQLSNAREMQVLLVKLGSEDTPLEEAIPAATSLAAFGRFAVPPLINELRSGQPNRLIAATEGLRMVAFSEPRSTCEELTRVLDSRTRAFPWQAQKSVIGVMADAGCREAVPSLERFAQLIGKAPGGQADLDRYSLTVRENPAPGFSSLDELREEVERTLAVLRGK